MFSSFSRLFCTPHKRLALISARIFFYFSIVLLRHVDGRQIHGTHVKRTGLREKKSEGQTKNAGKGGVLWAFCLWVFSGCSRRPPGQTLGNLWAVSGWTPREEAVRKSGWDHVNQQDFWAGEKPQGRSYATFYPDPT